MTTLHLICGLPGAGKTTLATSLERETQALRLCPDEWIEVLVGKEAARSELDRLRDPVERLQWQLAQRLLNLGVSAILENGFWSADERKTYCMAAKRLGVKVVLHLLDLPEEELWRRVQLRNAGQPDGGFRISRNELKEWDTWFARPDQTELKLYDAVKVYSGAEQPASGDA